MSATLAATLPVYTEHVNKNISKIWFDAEGLSPILAAFELKEHKDGAGRNYIQRVMYAPPATASADFATSQTKAQGTGTASTFGVARFEIPAVVVHNFAVFTRDDVDAAEGNPEEMFDVVDTAMKAAMLDLRNQLSFHVVERGWGRIGSITVAPTASPNTITLDVSLVNRITIGDDLGVAAAESTGAPRVGGSLQVTAIAGTTGVVTLSGDPTALSWAAGDIVFRAGNRDTASSPAKKLVSGLRAWLDHTTTSDTLFGVARAGNERLTGFRVDATNLTISDALLKAAARLAKNGSGDSDVVYLSTDDFTTLAQDKDVQKNVMIKMNDEYEIGFVGIAVMGPNGKSIKVLSDINLENGVAYMGPFNSGGDEIRPYLFHNGKNIVEIDDHDGNMFLRLSGSAAYECRLYFRGNAVVPAPAKYAVIYNIGVVS